MENEVLDKYKFYGKPPLSEAIPLGFQHVFAVYLGNVLPMILIPNILKLTQMQSTMLIQGACIFASLGTIIQLYPIPFFGGIRLGARLPCFMGLTYSFLSLILATAPTVGLAAIFGSQIVAALLSVFSGFFIKKFKQYLPPVVAGTVVLAVGLPLFPIALNNIAGGVGNVGYGNVENYILGFLVVFTTVILNDRGKGFSKLASILIAAFIGYIVSIFLGKVEFPSVMASVASSQFVAFPTPVAFGLEFRLDLIITFTIIYYINSVQIMGDLSVSSIAAFDRYPTGDELRNANIGNGIMCALAGVFNCFPLATYSQSSGMIAFTKVSSRYSIAIGAIMLFLIGLSPKLGAIMLSIPNPVVGGATLVVFSMIAMSGINLVTKEGFGKREMTIVGIAIATGLGLVQLPPEAKNFTPIIKILTNSAIVSSTIIAFILNLILKKEDEKIS